MLKIAVIGDRETVIGFKALGLDTFPVTGTNQARRVLADLTSEESEYAIIYLEETYAQELAHEIDKFKDNPERAIILVPGRDGATGLGTAALKAAVERAVGTDILGD